jgi:hypothetical protein
MTVELILQMTVDEQAQDDYCIIDCSRCEKEIQLDDEAFVWVERMGQSKLGIGHVCCSQGCADEAIASKAGGES